MADAQLGQQANINLGGYIPAPARQPKIWQQVLAQFLGNAATEGFQNLTAPDMSKEQQPWYKRNPNQQERASVENVKQGREQVDIARTNATTNKTQADANIRQGDARIEIDQGRNRLDALRTGADIERMAAQNKLAEQQLALAKDQFANAKTQQERDEAYRKIQVLMHLNDMQFNQRYKVQELKVQQGLANDKVSKTPSEIEKNLAEAEYARGTGRQTGSGAMTPEQKAEFLKKFKQQP